MRISGWSSDVCSSDLAVAEIARQPEEEEPPDRVDAEFADRISPGLANADQPLPRELDDGVDGVLLDPGEFAGAQLRMFARAAIEAPPGDQPDEGGEDRKSTRLNSSH